MQLTEFTDYAFRVLMHLAVRGDRLATTREIAERFELSSSHLTKVVWELGRAGFVETVRGRGGGLRLARPAEAISVGAVARHTEGTILFAECTPGDAARSCRIAPCCEFKRVLTEAEEAFFTVLDRYSLNDLTDRNRDLRGFFVADPP